MLFYSIITAFVKILYLIILDHDKKLLNCVWSYTGQGPSYTYSI